MTKCDRYYCKMWQLFDYKVRQKSITKCKRFFIKKYDNFIAICDSYYKLKQFYDKMRLLYQNMTFITNCDSTYCWSFQEEDLVWIIHHLNNLIVEWIDIWPERKRLQQICSLYDYICLVSDSSFIGFFKINSIRHFVHSALSSLVLRGVGILNELTSLPFLDIFSSQTR